MTGVDSQGVDSQGVDSLRLSIQDKAIPLETIFIDGNETIFIDGNDSLFNDESESGGKECLNDRRKHMINTGDSDLLVCVYSRVAILQKKKNVWTLQLIMRVFALTNL